MKINKVALIAISAFVLLNIYLGIKIYLKEKITDNVVRLHVVANSNDLSDQIEKLRIHSKVQDYINNLNIEEDNIIDTLKNNSDNILNIVNATLEEDNIKYNTAYLKIGKINYEEKQSATEYMPSGSYDSMQIVLGKGDGKNIWSFIFPDQNSIKKIENYNTILPNLSNIYNDTNNNQNDINVEYDFKILEVLNNIKDKIDIIL